MIQWFQAKGADVNDQNKEESTPLIMASYNGNLEIARILIRNGADVNVQNGDDETPLILAERYGYVELANFLKQNGAIDIENEEERGPKKIYFSSSRRAKQ